VNPDDNEQRKHRRVGVSLVPAARDADDPVPVWVFQEEGADAASSAPVNQSRSGFILNLSEGGLQVLTNAEEPLVGTRYEVQLLGLGDAVSATLGVARRVWSRPLGGMGQVNGFEYELRNAATAALFAEHGHDAADPQTMLRCRLTLA
jgi:hypothetical protein